MSFFTAAAGTGETLFDLGANDGSVLTSISFLHLNQLSV
jgi:hypothetical protein